MENLTYVIPTEEIALSEQGQRRQAAILAGKNRAAKLWNQPIGNLVARDEDYVQDFITPATPALVAGLSGWLSMPFAAAGAWYSLFANNTPAAIAPVCPTNQIWVFYKVSILTLAGPDPVSMLQFRTGTAANLKYQFNLENLYGKQVQDGYFSLPVTYENPEIATVQARSRVLLGIGCRIKLGTFIIETMQTTVV